MPKSYVEKVNEAQAVLDSFVKACREQSLHYGNSYALGYLSSAMSRIAAIYLTKAQFAEFMQSWTQAEQRISKDLS